MSRRTALGLLFACLLSPGESRPGEATDGFSFSHATGWGIHKIADSLQAPDIQCLTLDGHGRVIVSGPGYIRRLTDRDDDGLLESVEEILAGPERGAQGLVVVERYLYYVGGRGLERLDYHGDGALPNGPPTLILALATGGEHTAHAPRLGPDGALYLLGGNHSGLDPARVDVVKSPIVSPYAGLLLRLRPDGSEVEALAEGMRNPYDFDFLGDGEIVAWDSDSERDEGLPWYRPCRLYHLSPGADCGWRSRGAGKVPTHAFDTIRPAAEIGRGSPTGVVCGRHPSWPEKYRGGLFALDWTFGRILFFHLEEHGAGYEASWEVFLAASGDVPFAPTDIEVAPEGSLVVVSGGRGLEGAVYRIQPPGPTSEPARAGGGPALDGLELVLRAPCPTTAWSRQEWLPRARALPPARLLKAALDVSRPDHVRLRALDVLLEVDPAMTPRALAAVIHAGPAAPPSLRGRAAWWAGRRHRPEIVTALLGDGHPRVIRLAVEAAGRLLRSRHEASLREAVLVHARHPSRRVRQAVARVESRMPPRLPAGSIDDPRVLLVHGYALVLGSPRGRFPKAAFETAHRALEAVRRQPRPDREHLLDALRLLELCFERLQDELDPGAWLHEGWDRIPSQELDGRAGPLLEPLGDWSRSADPELSRQAARLIALLRAETPAAVNALLSRISSDSAPGDDVLTLSYLARLGGEWSPGALRATADAILGLPEKIESGETGRDRRWHDYVSVAWSGLVDRHPELANLVIDDPRFGHADHLALAGALEEKTARRAALRFARAPLPPALEDRRALLRLLGRGAPEASRPLLREALGQAALRREALEGLARAPELEDHTRFVDALFLGERALVEPAAAGLCRLPVPDPDTEDYRDEMIELLRWGLLLSADPAMEPATDRIAERLSGLLGALPADGAATPLPGGASGRPAFAAAARRLADTREDLAPDVEELLEEARSDELRLEAIVAQAAWKDGDPTRGRDIFSRLGCGSCHSLRGSGQRLGPDLDGIAKRFSPVEILEAILLPNKVVAPRYRAESITLVDGEQIIGLAVYDSRAAILLRTREASFRRLASRAIARRIPLSVSLMPTGLLDGVSVPEISDLVAFLQSDGDPGS